MQIKKYTFQQHGDKRGLLVALEEWKDIPFAMKRIYFMYGVEPGARRGFHAHRKLEQILVCIAGSCKIRLDSGAEEEVVVLENPYEGLYVKHSIWHEMYDFSEGAVLMAVASDYYKEEDYIRDYQEFKQLAAQGFWAGKE